MEFNANNSLTMNRTLLLPPHHYNHNLYHNNNYFIRNNYGIPNPFDLSQYHLTFHNEYPIASPNIISSLTNFTVSSANVSNNYMQYNKGNHLSSLTRQSNDFTIDAILKQNEHSDAQKSSSSKTALPNGNVSDSGSKGDDYFDKYNWLRCSRYKPPKIKRTNVPPKRKPLNRGPRIPFSSSQLKSLEEKFKNAHYLSSLEVNNLGEKLHLTEARIRIWFQNRRARQKREERERAKSDRQTSAEDHQFNHSSAVEESFFTESTDK